MERTIRIALTVIGLAGGFALSTRGLGFLGALTGLELGLARSTGMVIFVTSIGGLAGFLISPYVARQSIRFLGWLENRLQATPLTDILAGVFGLIIGLIIASLLGSTFARVPALGGILPILASLVFGYLGWVAAMKKKDDFPSALAGLTGRFSSRSKEKGTSASQAKILDTSVIIDGRIADICSSGFLEGPLVIPDFVLEELRHIADSPDPLKRNRGRRGLDILNKIRKEIKVPVQVQTTDIGGVENGEVDAKLVRLARSINGKVITNDFNLNKVAELQGVTVLNINELANAVKPVVLPGEEISVQIIKDGKESGQGVGYLEDGTMVVVDGGRRYIGGEIEVTVTSVLQTAAGRMIFARPSSGERSHVVGGQV